MNSYGIISYYLLIGIIEVGNKKHGKHSKQKEFFFKLANLMYKIRFLYSNRKSIIQSIFLYLFIGGDVFTSFIGYILWAYAY